MIKKIFSNTFYVKSLIFILSILVFLFLISIQNNLASQEQMKNDPINESTEEKENSSNKITQAQNDAVNQFRGYNESGWNNFVDSDGNIKSEYINSNGDLVDSTDIYADIKRLKLCND